jgi:uncharacterized protein (DUF2126 family)
MTNREKRLSTIIGILLIVVVIVTTNTTKLEQQVDKLQQPTQTKIVGQYTLIHYPNGGWINNIYITEYYIKDNLLWYREKGSTTDKPIWINDVLFADGWIEGKQLMNYGYWVEGGIE